MIVDLDLWGYKSWPPHSKEEHRLMVFENRVLRRLYDMTGSM
jgi:hypothetical protein